MTVKLLALVLTLAGMIPARASVAGAAVRPQAAAVIVLLAVAMAALAAVARAVRACPSSPHPCR